MCSGGSEKTGTVQWLAVLLLIAACLPDLVSVGESDRSSDPSTPLDSVYKPADSDSPQLTDEDQDGFFLEEGDCDDQDAGIHPGATDICDGRDQDCDDQIDEDATGDKFEPNDNQAHSLGNLTDDAMTLQATLTHEEDIDRYSFRVDDWYWVGPAINIRLWDIAANSDYAISLYSPTGDLLVTANDHGRGHAEELHWEGALTGQETGVYTAKVWSADGADCSRIYTLEVRED